MYLKWLVDRKGERVEKSEARQAFEGKLSHQWTEIATERGWTYVPMYSMTLAEWIELLLLGA